MMKNLKIYLLFFVLYLFGFMGCATLPPVASPVSTKIPGIYHRVEKSQTLWKISKIYNVSLEELVKINRIFDSASIEVGQTIFIPQQKKPLPFANQYSGEDFIWPVKGRVIATFGQNYNNMINKGMNIEPHRPQDVLAARSGKVIFYSPDFKGFGKTIIIDHGDGFSTVYAGNSEVLIKTGDIIQKGASIAKIGSMRRGRNPYLHFEIRKEHIAQNPYFYLPR
jgi:LysM repeat protein